MGLGKGMEIRGWVVLSRPALVFLWQDGYTALAWAKYYNRHDCVALLQAAMNKH